MSRNINIAKVWNPNNYQDIGTWYNNTGSYGSGHNFNTVLTENPLFFVEIYNTSSTRRAYRYVENPYYGFAVLSRDYSYPAVDKILFAALITYNTTDIVHAPFKIEFYTNYNRETAEIHNPIQEQAYGISSFYIKLQPEEWTAPSITTAQSRVSSITSSYSAHKIFPGDDINTIWNEKWWGKNGSSYGWQNNYQLDNFILNINNPYFPVFDNEQDLLDYLDDYENEQKASKALNYYDMSNDPSHSDERYKYKNLKDIMSSYKNKFENSDIYDFSSIDKEILTPLNNLILTYKGVNYDEKITELKNKYNEKLSEYMSLSNMALIDSSDAIVRELNMPYNEPLTPYLSYSGYTTTEFNQIKTYVEDKILTEYGAARDYLLIDAFWGDSTTDSNIRHIYVVVGDENGNNELSIRGVWRSEAGYLITKYYHMSSRDAFYQAKGCYYGEFFKFQFDRINSSFSDYVAPTIGYFYSDEYHGGGGARSTSNHYDSNNNIYSYGSLNTIHLNNFNHGIPFYASADFYVSGMSNITVEPDESAAGSVNISSIPDDYAAKDVTMLAFENYGYSDSLNDVVKEIYTYDEPHYTYKGSTLIPYHILYHVYSNRSLMFKATPNEDPYADVPTTGASLVFVKPVLTLFNRYEMSNINGWDGNKLKVTDGYLLAPQVGAGIKNNGLFTGIVIGVKQIKPNSNEDQRIGMFGFRGGIQSIFLNAEDGSAIFGTPGKGQITIDPLRDKGLLYSGNYWKDYNAKDGKPKSYSNSNLNHEGMLIDLTTPEIRFGNGNFVVDSSGHITAAGGGHIAGWKITDTTIESDVAAANGKMTIDSGATCAGIDANGNKIYTYGQAKIYSGTHSTLNSNSAGFYLSNDGLSIGPSFRINTSGSFYIGYNATTFGCTNLNDPKNYTISGNANSIYIGIEGIRLGQNFAVDDEGNIVTRHLIVSMKNGNNYDPIGCWIGNWQFASNQDGSNISGVHKVEGVNQWNRLWMATGGLIRAEKWTSREPDPNYSPDEILWEIRPDGTASFSDLQIPSGKSATIAGSLTVSGSATISGSLSAGGFTMANSSISSSSVTINSSGQIQCSELRATNVTVNGTAAAVKGSYNGSCSINIEGQQYTGSCSITI